MEYIQKSNKWNPNVTLCDISTNLLSLAFSRLRISNSHLSQFTRASRIAADISFLAGGLESISSTFYARAFFVFLAPKFRMKNARVKRWWNWHLSGMVGSSDILLEKWWWLWWLCWNICNLFWYEWKIQIGHSLFVISKASSCYSRLDRWQFFIWQMIS